MASRCAPEGIAPICGCPIKSMAEAASAVAELARQSQDLGLLVNEMRQG